MEYLNRRLLRFKGESCFLPRFPVRFLFGGSGGFFYLLILSLLISFPFPTYAVEGNNPKLRLDLIPPEVKAKDLDTTKLPMPDLFGLFFTSKYGYTDYGKEYKLAFQKEGVNNSIGIGIIGIDDCLSYRCTACCVRKANVSANLGLRKIGKNTVLETEMKANEYKINQQNYNNYTANFGGTFFGSQNILKTEISVMYEDELLWDAMLMLARNPINDVFAGIGICMPYIAPAVQLNWNVNNKVTVNALYKHKEVTSTFEEMYLTQPYIEVNPNLKHETYSIAMIKLIFGKNVEISGAYKYAVNALDFIHPTYPGNMEKTDKWESEIGFNLNRLENKTSFEYVPSSKYYTPKLKVKNILAFLFPYGIEMKMENQYIGERSTNLTDYFLYGLVIAKKFRHLDVWLKGSNLTNTKYYIVDYTEGYGPAFQAGIKFRI